MKQYEAVIEALKQNGGYATLGWLYRTVPQIKGVEWKTKTPFASIRRIVQDERFFFRIRPGLWALKEFKNRIPMEFGRRRRPSEAEQFNHCYYQGLLVEIGNLNRLETFVPNQDKNHRFLGKPLGDITTVVNCYDFTYDSLVKRARTVDVVWFNERKLPHSFFEVEHTTDIQNSLLKYFELQDFNAEFRVVADRVRLREYESRLAYSAFHPIARRVKFLSYETVSEMHTKSVEMSIVNQAW
jgi:hypothetical protein